MIDKKLPIYIRLVNGHWESRYPSSHHAKWQNWRPIPYGLSIMQYKRLREVTGVYRVLLDPGVLAKS